jgi:hypothetical protein
MYWWTKGFIGIRFFVVYYIVYAVDRDGVASHIIDNERARGDIYGHALYVYGRGSINLIEPNEPSVVV